MILLHQYSIHLCLYKMVRDDVVNGELGWVSGQSCSDMMNPCTSAGLLNPDTRKHASQALPSMPLNNRAWLSRGVHAGERIESASSAVLRIPRWSAVHGTLQ